MIAGVPYDAEVEYLESTGTQWINIRIDSIGRYRLDFEVSSYTELGSVIAVVDSTGGVFRGDSVGLIREVLSANSLFFQVNLGDWANLSSSIFGRYIADMNSTAGYFKMGTETINRSFSFINKDYVVLSAWNELGSMRLAQSKYYRLEIWNTNGVLVHDMIPVRVGSGANAVGYMYDRVTRKLFGNQGTGSFVIGPDVATPVMGIWRYPQVYTARDYVQDGLVAMWDGIENAGWGVHDPNATVWKDLSGNNRDATIQGSASIGEDYIGGSGSACVASIGFDEMIASGISSVNACCDMVKPSGTTGIYCQSLLDASFQPDYRSVGFNPSGSMFWKDGSHTQSSSQTALGKHSVYMATSSFYIDGNNAGLVSGALFDHLGYHMSMRIGGGWGAADNDSYPAANFMSGSKIHCIRLYSRVLTASEIAANYAVDKARFNLSEGGVV